MQSPLLSPIPVCAQLFASRSERLAEAAHADKGGVYEGKRVNWGCGETGEGRTNTLSHAPFACRLCAKAGWRPACTERGLGAPPYGRGRVRSGGGAAMKKGGSQTQYAPSLPICVAAFGLLRLGTKGAGTKGGGRGEREGKGYTTANKVTCMRFVRITC